MNSSLGTQQDSLFQILVLSLGNAGSIGLGLSPDPETNKTSVRLNLARENIELLDMLHSKTKGNLTSEEQNLLENMLYDLRLKYLEATKNSH
jgi:Domain of unknown function (DUF1844)